MVLILSLHLIPSSCVPVTRRLGLKCSWQTCMVRIPKEHISMGSSPISELLTSSRSSSVLYSNCEILSVSIQTVSPLLDVTRTDKRRKQKKGKRITVLCVGNQCFHLGSDKAGTSPHSAHRKADPHTHFCCKAASPEPCLSSEDHTVPEFLLCSPHSALSFLQPRCTMT